MCVCVRARARYRVIVCVCVHVIYRYIDTCVLMNNVGVRQAISSDLLLIASDMLPVASDLDTPILSQLGYACNETRARM